MVTKVESVWTLKLTGTQRRYLKGILSLAELVAPERTYLRRPDTTLRAALLVGLKTIARELETRAKKLPHFRRP